MNPRWWKSMQKKHVKKVNEKMTNERWESKYDFDQGEIDLKDIQR